MTDVATEITRRTLALGRKRHAVGTRDVMTPLLAVAGIMAAIVFFFAASLPAIKGPGFDHTAHYVDYPLSMVVLPRAIPIGFAGGVVALFVAMQLGNQMGSLFAWGVVGLIGAAVVVALALLLSTSFPSGSYLAAEPTDMFLMALLPIAIPVAFGAITGWRTAATA